MSDPIFSPYQSLYPLPSWTTWRRMILTLLVGWSSLNVLFAGEILREGDAFGGFEAKDQHDAAFQFKPGIRFVFVSFDMSTSKKANQALAELGSEFLPERHAIYVSNIYGMPAVGRFFAMPKMRKYPHRIILADEKDLLNTYPRKEDRVTVFQLDDQAKIIRISYWDPEKENLDVFMTPQSDASER